MNVKYIIRNGTSAVTSFISVHRAKVFTAGMLILMLFCVLLGLTSGISSAVKQRYSLLEKADIPVLSGNINNKETSDTPDEPRSTDKSETPEIPDIPKTADTPKPEPIKQKEKDQVEIKAKPPEKHVIKIGHIVQYDKLVTGCELISANVVLNYYDKNVNYEQIIKHTKFGKIHVSKDGKWYGSSPSEAFLGDPHRIDGMGCFAPVIVDMVDDFGFTDICAKDTTGVDLNELIEKYVANDIPVMIWVTDSMCPLGKGDVWHLTNEDGSISKETFTWPLNEHCVVLMGYDKNNYYLSDPLSYSECVKYDKKLVETRFKDLGCMSVVIETIDNNSKSAASTNKTTDSDSKSAENKNKTTESSSKSAENKNKTTDNSSKSSASANKTTESSSKPADNKNKTTDNSSKSSASTNKTTESSSKLADNKDKTTDSDSKPATNTNKTTDSNSKPAAKTNKTTDSDSKPAASTNKTTDSNKKTTSNDNVSKNENNSSS